MKTHYYKHAWILNKKVFILGQNMQFAFFALLWFCEFCLFVFKTYSIGVVLKDIMVKVTGNNSLYVFYAWYLSSCFSISIKILSVDGVFLLESNFIFLWFETYKKLYDFSIKTPKRIHFKGLTSISLFSSLG